MKKFETVRRLLIALSLVAVVLIASPAWANSERAPAGKEANVDSLVLSSELIAATSNRTVEPNLVSRGFLAVCEQGCDDAHGNCIRSCPDRGILAAGCYLVCQFTYAVCLESCRSFGRP